MSVRTPASGLPDSRALELSSSAPRPIGRFSRGTALERFAPAHALDQRLPSVRGRLGLAAAAGLLLSALALTAGAANTNALLPESVRPIPRWLAGPFGTTGPGLGVVGLVAALSVMFVSYVCLTRSAQRLSARTLLMVIAALHALVLLAPPLLSTDVFSYQAYARMGSVYGANPYLHGPSSIALDPLYPFIGADWVSTPTAYGPVFTLLSYLLAPLSIAASALSYKAIAALASLATVALVWNAARLRGLDPRRAAALVGLNPLVIVYGVGGGHNDLLMLAPVVAGVYLMLSHRERSAGASLVLATGVKLTAGLLFPFALAGSRRPQVRDRRKEVLIGAGMAAAAVALAGAAVFGTGPLNLVSTLGKNQSHGDWHSIPGFITTRLGLGDIGHVTGLLLGAAFLGTSVWLLRRVWRGSLDWIDGAGWSTFTLLLCAGSLLPWYVAWLMPLAALSSDRRLTRNALVLTGVVQGIQMLGYIPHGVSLLGL